ncbi:MAG: NAD(P)-dependent oxidoreductase [Chloroflexota bacterium]
MLRICSLRQIEAGICEEHKEAQEGKTGISIEEIHRQHTSRGGQMKEKVGFVGLGTIGAPMARRVANGGYQLVVYDVRPEAMRPFAEKGATAASSPKDVATKCSNILFSLPDSPIIEEVILGKDGIVDGAARGTLIVDLSSAHPASTIKLGKELAPKGIDIIDAPVSGGRFGAEAGTLAVMVGGRKELLERARPIISTFGKTIFHCGELGSGDTVKAVNNFLSAMSFIGTGEALILATKAGLDPQTALDVINASSGQNKASSGKFKELVMRGDFDRAKSMSMRLFYKDLSTAADLGAKLGVPMFIIPIIQQLLAYGVAMCGPESPNTELIRTMEQWVGVKVRDRDILAKEEKTSR